MFARIMLACTVTLTLSCSEDGRSPTSDSAVPLEDSAISPDGSPVDGQCGSADGVETTLAPSSDLCSAGTPSAVAGTGPWSWTCEGANGGSTASCSAPVAPEPVDGQCGSANGVETTVAPSSDLCSAGTPSAVAGTGPWSWTCVGANGGSTASCSAPVAPDPVDGQCGSANGVETTVAPSSDLCSAGTPSAVTGTGPWTWTCVGANGGSSASCSAPVAPDPVDGQCGSADGVATTVAPTAGLCSAGTPSAVTGSGPWTWTCEGANGGSSASCSAPAATSPGTCSSITQWGITWTFDKAYICGQFVNGDYWVIPDTPAGVVRITAISPAYAGGRNGWEVNPSSIVNQGFDTEAPDFQASLVPSLPYDAAPDSSVVKAVSNATGCDGGSGGKTCLTTAAVLTVLASAPADNGATVFRPPYFGAQKPLFSTNTLNWSALPSLSTTSSTTAAAPSLSDALNTIRRVQLAHKNDWIGDQIHPAENFQLTDPYGPDVSNQNANAALRAMLQVPGDSSQDRNDVIVALVQYGIDNYGVLINGANWHSNGGHDMGMRLPIALAGLFLDDADITSALAAAPRHVFAETDMTYMSPHTGVALWGQDRCNYGSGAEQIYWDDITAEAARVCVDPYGYIDGGPSPGGWYQGCCTSQALKGSALVVRLVPGLEAVWNDDVSLEYADRWVTQGALTAPDPCAPLSQGGGPDPGQAGQCILDPDLAAGSTFTSFSCQAGQECGRFPSLHLTGADSGGHRSLFVDAMWSAFRP